MSVSGFSTQYDPEVQAYNRLRAAYLTQEKQRKAAIKLQKRQVLNMVNEAERTRPIEKRRYGVFGWLRLQSAGSKSVSVNGRVVETKTLEDDGDCEDGWDEDDVLREKKEARKVGRI